MIMVKAGAAVDRVIESLEPYLEPGDIVIGEDAMELRWYAGQTDYWFRSLDDAGRYLYRDENDILRDIYVGAALLDGAPEDDVLRRAAMWQLHGSTMSPSLGRCSM